MTSTGRSYHDDEGMHPSTMVLFFIVVIALCTLGFFAIKHASDQQNMQDAVWCKAHTVQQMTPAEWRMCQNDPINAYD